MTLDTTSLITLTDAALEGGNALSAMAGAVTASTATDAGTMIVVIGSSPHAQQVMEQRSNALCATGDLLCRSNLVTLPARENAQRFAGLLGMLGVDALLLDPVLFAPITRGHALEAEPRLLHAKRYEQAALRHRVLVIAGGVGRTPEGDTTSLGTGGAELSGLFIAQRLGLPVSLVVSSREIDTGYALPKRAELFARKHGVSYALSVGIETGAPADEPVPA